MPGMVRTGDTWTGTCALGHPPGPYGPTLPGIPVPVSGVVVGTASSCLADGVPKAKVGIDIVIADCGHIAIIVTGAIKSMSEGSQQAIVGSVATLGAAPIIITGIIVNGSPKCLCN